MGRTLPRPGPEKDVIDPTKQDLRHVGLIKDLMRISDWPVIALVEVSENEGQYRRSMSWRAGGCAAPTWQNAG